MMKIHVSVSHSTNVSVSKVLIFGHRIHILPMESSKLRGLVPTDGSIIVTSNRDANRRKSSFSPRKP